MKKAILVAIIGAMTLGVNAGDWGKAPVPAKAPIEECVDIGGEISAGYMTDYIFRGAQFARDSVWTDVNYTFDNFVLPLNVGVWYLNGITPAGVDELNLYVSADIGTYYGFDVNLGYTHLFFPETNGRGVGAGSYGEIILGTSRSLGFVDFSHETVYAFNGRGGNSGGWYHEAALSKTFGVTDNINLVITGGAAWSHYYRPFGVSAFANGSTRTHGFNHYFVTAELPIELNCRATLTPYIGYNGSPDGSVTDGINTNAILNLNGQSDILHGGVSLSVSF